MNNDVFPREKSSYEVQCGTLLDINVRLLVGVSLFRDHDCRRKLKIADSLGRIRHVGGKNGNVKGLVKRIYRDMRRREIHELSGTSSSHRMALNL